MLRCQLTVRQIRISWSIWALSLETPNLKMFLLCQRHPADAGIPLNTLSSGLLRWNLETDSTYKELLVCPKMFPGCSLFFCFFDWKSEVLLVVPCFNFHTFSCLSNKVWRQSIALDVLGTCRSDAHSADSFSLAPFTSFSSHIEPMAYNDFFDKGRWKKLVKFTKAKKLWLHRQSTNIQHSFAMISSIMAVACGVCVGRQVFGFVGCRCDIAWRWNQHSNLTHQCCTRKMTAKNQHLLQPWQLNPCVCKQFKMVAWFPLPVLGR